MSIIQNNLEQYIKARLPFLIVNHTVEEASNLLYNGLSSIYSIGGNKDDVLDVIKNAIIEYQKTGKIDEIVSDLSTKLENFGITSRSNSTTKTGTNVITNNNSTTRNTPSSNNNRNNNTSGSTIPSTNRSTTPHTPTVPTTPTTTARNINVDTDSVEQAINTYSNMQASGDGSTINADGYVGEVFNQYSGEIADQEAEINAEIQEAGQDTVNMLAEIGVLDDDSARVILRDSVNFSELVNAYSVWQRTGSRVQVANASTFENAGYRVEGNVVKITGDDGIKYTYNIDTGLLTDDQGHSLTVRYYVPSACSDLSGLNTVTCLGGHNEKSMYEMTGSNDFYLGSISTDAILVFPRKNAADGDSEPWRKGISYAYMADDVAASTKFANAFARQQPEKSNVILGCSSGGGSALKIAGSSGSLYDTVVSINYAPFFSNDSRGVNQNFRADDNRLYATQVQNLNGKNLVFISTRSDENLERKYVKNGLTRLVDECPASDITFISNGGSIGITNSNFHYYGASSEFWSKNFANYDSYSHGSYHKVFRDILNSGILV